MILIDRKELDHLRKENSRLRKIEEQMEKVFKNVSSY